MSVPRSARFVAWGNAFLGGHASLDEASLRIAGGDAGHRVTGLPGDPESLVLALGRLRALGVTGLRLVLPVPGDPVGLPGPAGFNAEAVAAGEAAVSAGAAAYGLVPRAAADGWVTWAATPVQPPRAGDAPVLAQAERELTETLLATTAELQRLDVARWRPEIAEQLAAVRAGAGAGSLAPGYPGRAHRVLAQADRLAAIVELAADDPGGAVSHTAIGLRSGTLRALGHATRRARMAAYNAVLEPAGEVGEAG